MRTLHPPDHHISFALKVLFGPSHNFRHPHRLPDIKHLKQIFRRRSLEAHPDRARALGRKTETLTKEFQDLSRAYCLILPLLEKKGSISDLSGQSRAPVFRRPTDDFFWTLGIPPAVPLRFAQYVYYRGLISYRTLIRMLVLQMKTRPRVGDIALAHGTLTHPDVRAIFAGRRRGERFLHTAVRLGLLSGYERHRILTRQRGFNLPIGRIMVTGGLLSRSQCTHLLDEFYHHNLTCSVRTAS